ncbi:hypothetical protein ABLN67_10065 [Mycobacterium tuberculosis]
MFNRFIYRREWVFAFIVKRFRVFVRRFSVVYIVDDAARVITVTRVGHRRGVYR